MANRTKSQVDGAPPQSGWARMVVELHVSDLETSLLFWRDVLGFKTAFERAEERFVICLFGTSGGSPNHALPAAWSLRNWTSGATFWPRCHVPNLSRGYRSSASGPSGSKLGNLPRSKRGVASDRRQAERAARGFRAGSGWIPDHGRSQHWRETPRCLARQGTTTAFSEALDHCQIIPPG